METIYTKTDLVITGVVIGIALCKITELVFKWSELKLLNDERKRYLLLGKAISDMQDKLEKRNL